MRWPKFKQAGIVSGKSGMFLGKSYFLRKSFNLRSRIEILGSEGVHLDEICRTNPSRHLPGPKTPVKKLKRPMLGSRRFGGGSRGFRAYKIGCGAALKGPYSCLFGVPFKREVPFCTSVY